MASRRLWLFESQAASKAKVEPTETPAGRQAGDGRRAVGNR
jgi:hypothetical protein